MSPITLDPVKDAAGAVKMTAGGTLEYPALRSFTRNNPDCPGLNGMRAWFSFGWGDGRTFILPRDVVFLTAIVNSFVLVIVVAPAPGGCTAVWRGPNGWARKPSSMSR